MLRAFAIFWIIAAIGVSCVDKIPDERLRSIHVLGCYLACMACIISAKCEDILDEIRKKCQP